MLKLGVWMIAPLLFLPLFAQESQVLPEDAAGVPVVDTITPVPPPEIPFAAMGAATPAMPADLKIVTDGPISGSKDGGVVFEGPGLKLSGDKNQEVFADRAVWDPKTKTVTLDGHVSIYQGNILQRGDNAVYFYERKFLDTSNLKVSMDPILLEAGKFRVEKRGESSVYVGENAGITTNDVQDPNFWIRSKKTTIYPGNKIVFEDMRVYAGDLPVFWLPYLAQPLDAELGYHFIPGSRSNLGVYLFNTYGIMLGGKHNEKTGENEDWGGAAANGSCAPMVIFCFCRSVIQLVRSLPAFPKAYRSSDRSKEHKHKRPRVIPQSCWRHPSKECNR